MWQHFDFLASDMYATYANDDARGLRTSALRTVWRCVQSVCYASNKHAFAYIKRDAGNRPACNSGATPERGTDTIILVLVLVAVKNKIALF